MSNVDIETQEEYYEDEIIRSIVSFTGMNALGLSNPEVNHVTSYELKYYPNVERMPVPDPKKIVKEALSGELTWDTYLRYCAFYYSKRGCVLLIFNDGTLDMVKIWSIVKLLKDFNALGDESYIEYAKVLCACGFIDPAAMVREKPSDAFMAEFKKISNEPQAAVVYCIREFMQSKSTCVLNAIFKLIKQHNLMLQWYHVNSASDKEVTKALFMKAFDRSDLCCNPVNRGTAARDNEDILEDLIGLSHDQGVTGVYDEICKTMRCVPAAMWDEQGPVVAFEKTWRAVHPRNNGESSFTEWIAQTPEEISAVGLVGEQSAIVKELRILYHRQEDRSRNLRRAVEKMVRDDIKSRR